MKIKCSFEVPVYLGECSRCGEPNLSDKWYGDQVIEGKPVCVTCQISLTATERSEGARTSRQRVSGEPQHLKILVGCACNVRFDAGPFILRESEEANNFYIIRHGKVSLEIFTPDRGPITIQPIGEGGPWLVMAHSALSLALRCPGT